MKRIPHKATQLIVALFSFIGGVIVLSIMEILFLVGIIKDQTGLEWLFTIVISIFILVGAFFYTRFFLKHVFGIKRFSFLINLSIVNFSFMISGINFIFSLYSAGLFKSPEFMWGALIPFAIILISMALVSIIYDLLQNLKDN